SDNFDRSLEDVFAVQDEVARAIVTSLEVHLGGPAGSAIVDRETQSLDAYNAYLLGRYYWNKRTMEDMIRAEEYFLDAIAADSSYALAWSGLADTYALFAPSEYDVRTISGAEALDRGERAARRAIAIDSTLAEAHNALAAILEKRLDFAGAERAFRRAIELNPNYPTARQWFGGLLVTMGRVDEGLARCSGRPSWIRSPW
ncbi:MAG: tetratricopeptide repeat protein, partial [Gemmatimonadales bacterium]